MRKHLIQIITLVTVMLMMPQAQAAEQEKMVPQSHGDVQDGTMPEAEEEVNTNDPTAAAISASFGWEFYNWHDDRLSSGKTRPQGNNNNFNTRFVIPLAAGTLGSPWPIINRFSFANVEAEGGTSGSGNAEFITLFVPWKWGTGKIGIGPAINLPADDEQFGADVWRYGFAAVFLENSLEGRLMWGTLIRQVWGKTDPNKNSYVASAFVFQPIAVYKLDESWYISNGESPIAYHWQDKEFLVPLGIRLGKTIEDDKGGVWNVYGEYRTNIVYKNWKGAAAKDIIRINASYTFGN